MKTLIAVLCVVFALMVGCNDEDSCINCPTMHPTLENIWPNADLTSWTYDYQAREWEGIYTIYPTLGEVPTTPLPNWNEIFNLCESHAPKTPFATTDRVYTMLFNGMTTTTGGVTAQNLMTALVVPGQSAGQVGGDRASALLQRLCAARPDLREKILSSLGDMPAAPGQIERSPILVHGGAWEKTSTYIGTYGDLGQRIWWKFLTNKLSPGSSFSYQLFPDIDPQLVMRCRVYRTMTVTTPAGTFPKALDCLYVLDYGIATVTDLYGNPIGFVRTFDYGRVIYAPEIGPVHSYERWGVEPGTPPSDGFMDITISLTASSTLED